MHLRKTEAHVSARSGCHHRSVTASMVCIPGRSLIGASMMHDNGRASGARRTRAATQRVRAFVSVGAHMTTRFPRHHSHSLGSPFSANVAMPR
eukprot:3688448-Pyramimonas_sp.AAC.1